MNYKKRTLLLSSCLTISLLGHTFLLSSVGLFGNLDFARPVNKLPIVEVDLKDRDMQNRQRSDTRIASELPRVDKVLQEKPHGDLPITAPVVAAKIETDEDSSKSAPIPETAVVPKVQNQTVNPEPHGVTNSAAEHIQQPFVPYPPLMPTSDFMGTTHEKLVYRISLLGLPVGSAELEASSENEEIRITLRVKSDAVLSSIYPVDDLIETRHINGNFILTRIRQQEGAFRGDRGFTIFLRDKSVFWIDRLTKRSLKESLPDSDVVDMLSGLYYLRNRPLSEGLTEILHIYDSDKYTAVPVDILRREKILLPGFRQIATLVVHPKLETEGIFKRTGDVFIWLSDDEFRVPVKFITTIALGQVTAELVSAESQRSDGSVAQKQFPQMSYSGTNIIP